jgi:6-phosphogluconolactonase
MEHLKKVQVLLCQMLLAFFTYNLSACGGSGTPTPPPRTLRSIQINPQSQSFAVGSSLQLSAAGTYSDGSTGNVTSSVTWSSSDTTLASVNGSGDVSGLAVGRPKITATSGSVNGSTQLILTGSLSNNFPRLAFVPNMVDGTLSAYTVNSSTGQLRHNGYQLVGGFPGSVVVEPRNKFVYVANSEDSTITAFAIDQFAGMSPISGSPFKDDGNPLALAVDPSGTYLYSANSGSGTVVAYLINSSTGALTPLASAGPGSSALAIDPSGHFLFVANQAANNISAFIIAVDSGALSPITGSPFTPGMSPSAVAVDSAGRLLFVANSGSSNVSVFSITAGTGGLSQVTGSPFPTGAGMEISGIAVTPDGKTVYVSNFGSSSISALSVAASGTLAPVTGSPFLVDSDPRALQVDPSGKFAFVPALTACEVEVYSIAADGSLAVANRIRTRQQAAAIAFTAGTTPVSYAPKFAYTVDSLGGNSLSQYGVDPASGAFTSLGSPLSTPGPRWLAVSPSGKFVYRRTTRLHHEIPALRKPSSSSSRKSPLTASYQPLVYSRIVGNPYLGIISGSLGHSGRMLSLTCERSRIRQDYGLGRRQQVSAIRLLSERSDPRVNQRLTSSGSCRRFSYVLFVL